MLLLQKLLCSSLKVGKVINKTWTEAITLRQNIGLTMLTASVE